jgi:hypothetical protein
MQDVHLLTPDGLATLDIGAFAILKTDDAKPLPYVGATECVESPPPPPAGKYLIGCVYDFKPDKATLSPPAAMTIEYKQADVPQVVNEASLTIAYFDAEQGLWVELVSVVDTLANNVKAYVSHLTMFGIIGTPTPAPTATPTPIPTPPPPAAPLNVWLIIGPIVGALLIVVILLLVWRRRTGFAT